MPFPSPADLPNPGIELGLPHCRQMLYHPSHLKPSQHLAWDSNPRDWNLNQPNPAWEYQPHGFKSQTGFWLGSSPSTWVQVPVCGKQFHRGHEFDPWSGNWVHGPQLLGPSTLEHACHSLEKAHNEVSPCQKEDPACYKLDCACVPS